MDEDTLPADLVTGHLETSSYDTDVDWGRYPDLGEDPDEYADIPEHIGKWMVDPDGETERIQKADTPDQQLVTGWASVLEEKDGSTLFDREGDSIEEPDLVEAVHKYMETKRHAGEVHMRQADGSVKSVGTIVESLVVTKALRNVLGLPSTFPTGWLITVKVSDAGVWSKVKSGEYKAFSVGGAGTREPLA